MCGWQPTAHPAGEQMSEEDVKKYKSMAAGRPNALADVPMVQTVPVFAKGRRRKRVAKTTNVNTSAGVLTRYRNVPFI